MPKIPCNALAVRSRLKGERAVYQIEGVPGLHLAVLGDGKGSWRVRYRPQPRALQRWFTLGNAQIVELGDAVKKARDLLSKLHLERADPHAHRDRQAAEGRTFADVYREWLDNPARERVLRERSRIEAERIFRLHVSPRIALAPIRTLERGTIIDALDAVRDATTDAERGHRGLQATKALQQIRAVCRFAVKRGYSDRDPTLGIDRPVPDKNPHGRQHRPPTNDELRAIWNAASSLSPGSERVLRLAILLGKRVSELVGCVRDEVVLGTDPHLLIPGTREGNKSRESQRVPLPPLAEAIFRGALAECRGRFPFPSDESDDLPMTRQAPSRAFRKLRDKLGLPDCIRFHDMRGSLISWPPWACPASTDHTSCITPATCA